MSAALLLPGIAEDSISGTLSRDSARTLFSLEALDPYRYGLLIINPIEESLLLSAFPGDFNPDDAICDEAPVPEPSTLLLIVMLRLAAVWWRDLCGCRVR